MLAGDDRDLPNENLGELLYARVECLCPAKASHVTGILLEAGDHEVTRMMREEALLRRRVEGAERVLRENTDPESVSREDYDKGSLGEKLYFRVQELDAQHCAKVTGMLLELDPVTINNLLASPHELHRAVQKATAILLGDEQDSYPVGLNENKQELGEELYNMIEETHPELASKITGMLLEMDVMQLQQLLNQPAKLNEKVQLAVEALRKAANLPQ